MISCYAYSYIRLVTITYIPMKHKHTYIYCHVNTDNNLRNDSSNFNVITCVSVVPVSDTDTYQIPNMLSIKSFGAIELITNYVSDTLLLLILTQAIQKNYFLNLLSTWY